MANQIDLRAAAARLLYSDNRDTADYDMLIEFIDSTFREQEVREDVRRRMPLTQKELREMDGQTVYCLELNTEVRVSARKTGWITIHYPLPMEKDCCKAHGLTLYRTRPKEDSV